jgi:hypothetical protein
MPTACSEWMPLPRQTTVMTCTLRGIVGSDLFGAFDAFLCPAGAYSCVHKEEFHIIGANLFVYNDVTKRASSVIIDLRRAIRVEDIPDLLDRVLAPPPQYTPLSAIDEYW